MNAYNKCLLVIAVIAILIAATISYFGLSRSADLEYGQLIKHIESIDDRISNVKYEVDLLNIRIKKLEINQREEAAINESIRIHEEVSGNIEKTMDNINSIIPREKEATPKSSPK